MKNLFLIFCLLLSSTVFGQKKDVTVRTVVAIDSTANTTFLKKRMNQKRIEDSAFKQQMFKVKQQQEELKSKTKRKH
jgi:hypothetical protein